MNSKFTGMVCWLAATVAVATAIVATIAWWRASLPRDAAVSARESRGGGGLPHAGGPTAMRKEVGETTGRSDARAEGDASVAEIPGVAVSATRRERSAAELGADVRAALASGDPARREEALVALLPALIAVDAGAAGRLAEALAGDATLRAEVMQVVACLWAARDAGRAFAWAADLKIEYEREAALADVAFQAVAVDPESALLIWARHARDGEASAVMETLAQRWAEKDFPVALAWTLKERDGARRDSLVARMAFVKATVEPREAAALVVNEMKPGEAQNEAVISVLHRWAEYDLPAAQAWVGQFPEGTLRTRAVEELMSMNSRRWVAVKR